MTLRQIQKVWAPLAAVGCVLMLAVAPARGVLVHQYTFNSFDAADSEGTADGTLMGTASVGIDGTLQLTGGGAGNSYVDLPDGIASAASAGGNTGEITTEAWVNVNANANWAVIFSFGNSGPDPEDNNGADGDYWQLIPQAGNAPQVLRSTTHLSDPGGETFANDTVNDTPLATGSLQHVVNVLNVAADTNEMYVNGVLVGTSALHPGFDPNTYGTIGDTQNWLGRSQWGDPSFNGSIDEFRVYDHALTAQEVSDNFAEGPVEQVLLTLSVNNTNGQTTIRNDAAFDVEFNYYEITSPGGALDEDAWNSLDEQGIDSVGGGDEEGETWDEAGGSNEFLLTELFLQGTTTLTPGETQTLGAAFDTSVFEPGNDGDLSFAFALPGQPLVSARVEYVIDPGGLSGDFNGDGQVDAADYTVYRDNLGGDESAFAAGSGSGDNVIDINDYNLWRANFGETAGSGSLSAADAVPEPASVIVFGTLGLFAVGFNRRLRTYLAGLVAVALIAASSVALADTTDDRIYRFGDDDANPLPGLGAIVGSSFLDPQTNFPTTFDSMGSGGEGNFQDLFVNDGVFGNDPRYIAPSNSSLSASQRAAEFDGDDFLFGRRLGLPSTSDPAVGLPADGDDTDGLAPEDYSGISNRGFQLWVRPGSDSALQSVVLDTNQHGLQITAAGNWSMRYAGTDYDSGVAVTVGQWDHLMVVRPSGAANGARLYLNGNVIAAAPGGYTGGDNARLVIGANTSEDDGMVGMSEFFVGAVDDLDMFIMGTSTDTSTNYGTFNAGTDNDAIAAALSGRPQGDLDGDGSVNDSDINTFIANWLTAPKTINDIAVGDLSTYALGDLDFSGIVDIDDAFILHEGIQLAGGAGLDFGLLGGGSVPEPGTMWLTILALLGLVARKRVVARR